MHKQRLSALLACGFFTILLTGSGARADDVYGGIRGTVTDPSGAVIPGVPVTATNIAKGIARTVKTLRRSVPNG